jgi:methanogenic corrinoid protein MtbC1
MDEFKSKFMSAFEQNNKDKCIELSLEHLSNNTINIPSLYEDILTPALYSIDKCTEEGCIWKEHVKTSIVRAVIECVYPNIIKFKKNISPNGIKVVLACPEKEHHEIGLRMMSDFFTLNGYESIYIGSNTPRDQVCIAISQNIPKYVAISVTDYYLLFEAQKMIKKIRSNYGSSIKIIVGGLAFKNNSDSIKDIGGDIFLNSFKDIENLRKEEIK